jgi:NADH:ubiquinone oxidoreductase subunit E
MGTACYLKGAPQLLEHASQSLGIHHGETTKDGEFHLQMVRCVGCCGLAPVVTINETLLAKMTVDSLEEHLCACKNKGEGKA